MRSEPGHTWGGSTLSAQRLQEPALLGLPMYEAHRSWQLPGQCRAAIIMFAARNRIRYSPALLLAWAGGVTAACSDAPFLGSIYYAGCGCHPLACIACAAMSPAFVGAFSILRMLAMCARAVSRDAGGAVDSGRCSVRGTPAGRSSAGHGAADVSLRPAHRRNSPVNTRFTKAKK